ncbi:hypothetical protein CcrColossus_gp288 [Caulobacter phage CcrColossus]|uniref:Uncharacterized protein n=1 Tax=Caulobacter phage CcrColossus TaxID=1211640 RepID=K4JW83_9CAUD|nr:hypothetical protein CcrColossus_gp288 [Caulobacter phage CcrColossus]AFU88158.1 hypothetical protein CcrColossus_gp288 [Caulobacter phage CcrColossus]
MLYENISIRGPVGDARDERVGKSADAERYVYEPSPNLKAFITEMYHTRGSTLDKIGDLAAKIERGDASGSEEESLQVYDALPVLYACIEDLVDMCRRREQALWDNHIAFGR